MSLKHSANKRLFSLLVFSLFLGFTTFGQDHQNEPPKIVRRSGGVLQGSASKRVEPTYPPLAKAARISGSVVVEVTLDEEGNVIGARAISGHPLLKDSAVAAAREWKFSQTKLQGVPVKVIGTLTFNYSLDMSDEIEKLNDQLRANPDSPELHFKLGMAYDTADQDEKAVREFEEALRLKPDYPDAHLWVGRVYKSQGRYESAIEAFQQALHLKPDDADEVHDEIHMELARCYLRLNRSNEAAESAKQALSIKPDSFLADEAHTIIGLVLVDQGRHDEALDYFKAAAKMSPQIPQVHFYLGLTYVLKGDRESATKEYEILKEKNAPMAEQLLKRINSQQ